MKHGVTIINIEMPWWLNWAKRYVKVNAERITAPKTLTGRHIDCVIMDEAI